MSPQADVVVVGSLNLDIVVPVPHHPRPGETVLGGDHFRNPGGKGANQAVAAARLGAATAMVGRVGDDDFGRSLRGGLGDALDVRHVMTTPSAPTGLALITVDDDGENAIAVSPGANHRLSAEDVGDADALIRHARVVLAQLEVPVAAVTAAADVAEGVFILNPAPARELPDALLAAVDILVPNRGELARLVGADEPSDMADAAALARRLEGPDAVIVTMGAQGAVLVAGEQTVEVPSLEVETVDTTAAGDAFCGALAAALSRNEDLEAAVRWARVAAALATTRRGAQASLPRRDEVEEAAR